MLSSANLVVKRLFLCYIFCMEDPQHLTKETYNKIAEAWAQDHSNLDFWKEEFEAFKKLLPIGKILDVGCGPGHHTQFLQEVYDYTGVDYSEQFIELAKQKFPDTTFILGNMLDLPFKENEFDGFWAAASLLHIPKENSGTALGEIGRVVKENGIGFIALKKGEGQKIVVDEDDPNDKRFFAYWQKNEFQQVLEENGFELLKFSEHPTEGKTTWLVFFIKNI